MAAVGTLAWAERTNGRLRRRDRARLLAQVALAQLGQLPGPWQRLVLGKHLSLSLPEPPDSRLARAAEARMRELSTPGLHAHCLRTWLFAALFAERDRIDHDKELLYLACVLHDLGLTKPHNQCDPTAECFAVEGSRAASRLLSQHGERAERTRTVAEAISLHLNITVPRRMGEEAHLLNKGAMLDVVGRYANQLPTASTREVIELWPRDELAESLFLPSAMQSQVRPHARAAFMQRLPGIAERLAANPLDR